MADIPTLKKGRLRASKTRYEDGEIGCCVWQPFEGDNDGESGLAWDFDFADIDDLIALLVELKKAEPE